MFSSDEFNAFKARCHELGLDWPEPVIEQFLYNHGDKGEFLEQYGELDLSVLRWSLEEVPASELDACTCYPPFRDLVDSVASHAHWKIDQYRSIHGDSVWTGTWRVPPVMLAGAICAPPQQELHLVEGHTRLGVLTGLIKLGEVAPDSMHLVYVGSSAGPGEEQAF